MHLILCFASTDKAASFPMLLFLGLTLYKLTLSSRRNEPIGEREREKESTRWGIEAHIRIIFQTEKILFGLVRVQTQGLVL